MGSLLGDIATGFLSLYIHKVARALRALCLLGCLSQLEEVLP
jgi:hypothetical protein